MVLKAAFESVSNVTLRTLNNEPINELNIIDVRFARLPPSPPPDDGFDPRDYRTPTVAIETYMAYINVIRVGFGSGLLGMPFAVSQLGMLFGGVIAILTGALIIHLYLVLLWCQNEISRQLRVPYISYRYGFRIALLQGPFCCRCFAEWGPCIVATFMILSQVGICTVFVIFSAESLRDILDEDHYTKSLLYLFVPYLLLMISMKSLKYVSYISILGNVTNLVAMVLVYYHFLSEPHGEVVWAKFDMFTFFFVTGTLLFNMSSVGVILTLDKALHYPKVMTSRYGVVPLGMSVTVAVSTITGMVGYWSVGTLEVSVIRALPYEDTTAMVAMGLFMVTVSMTYPLQSYPGIQILIEAIKNHQLPYMTSMKYVSAVDKASKPIFVLITFVIAYYIPFQAPFVAFVGTSCTTLLSVVFPCLMNLCVRYPSNYGKCQWIMVKDLLLVIIGVVWWVIGVCFTVYVIKLRLLSLESVNNPEYL